MNIKQNKGEKTKHVKLMSDLVSEWRESGKTQLEFSKEKGINYYTFNKWVNDDKRKKVKTEKQGFTPLSIRTAVPFAEIRNDSTTIIFHQAVPADFLRAILK